MAGIEEVAKFFAAYLTVRKSRFLTNRWTR